MEVDLKNGMSVKDFCKKYNVCRKTYSTYKKLAIPEYKRVYTTTVKEDEFIKFYSEHPNIKECSEYFGMSENQCYKYKKRWIK
jgi:transposase